MKLRTTLRAYQREAVEKSRPHAGFAFFNEPRTGKTLIALAVAVERRVKRILIVCPPVAVKVWESQIDLHVSDPCEFQVITLGSLRPRIRKLRKWNPDLMIIDESHRIKRRGSRQSRACRTMGKNIPNRLLLTGTPIGQGSQDSWSQLNFLDPVAFPRYADFAERYLRMGGYFKKKVVGFRNVTELAGIIEGYSHRVTLNEAQGYVTRVQKKIIPVKMTPYQRQVYRSAEAGMIELASGKKVDSSMMLTQAVKLQQIAGGHVILPKGEGVEYISHEKMTALKRRLQEVPFPVVIVARFVHELDGIEALVAELGRSSQRVSGGVEYSGTFTADVMVLQIQSGGVSIDLARADRIIWYSWNYSHLEHEQARFRILSYNKPKINYDYLVVEDSVDEVLYDTIRGKKVFASALIDHYTRKENMSDIDDKIEAARKDLTAKKTKKKKAVVVVVATKKGPTRKVAAKVAEPEKAKGKKTTTGSEITLADLAAESKLPASKIRRLLRATMKQEGGAKQHWKFAPGSANLKAARQAIGLK